MQIGGMALREGVLLLSERHWAAAVRAEGGEIQVSSGERVLLPGRDTLKKIPVLRGATKLAESITVLPRVRRRIGSPVLPQEDPKLFACAAAGAVVSTLVRQTKGGSPLLKELVVAALSIGPALMAVRDRRLASFHGAEHKSIAAYESGGEAAEAAREHVRCGSNLIAPLAATSVVSNMLLRRAGAERNPIAVLGAGILSVGGAVELFSWMARHEGHPLAQLLRRPGLELQRLVTTGEPSKEQLDVADAALRELLRLEGAEPPAQPA